MAGIIAILGATAYFHSLYSVQSSILTTSITTIPIISSTSFTAPYISTGTTTSGTSTTTFKSVSAAGNATLLPNSSEDYDLWVKPYLAQLAKIEAILTQSYTPGSQASYGYYSPLGLTCGGSVERSTAIAVSNGYNDVCVLVDDNLEGGASLDYFAGAQSPLIGEPGFNLMNNLSIYENTRRLLSMPFYGIGPCSQPFEVYYYPSNFTMLDRREAEYGFADPYAAELVQPGIHIGGTGSLTCNGHKESGQIWYLEDYDTPSSPMIVTELPNSTAPSTTSSLDTLSFLIDEMYMQCVAGVRPCSDWQGVYLNAMAQYPFAAPRDALHFIQVTRATGAWAMSNLTYNGMSAETMLNDTIAQIFTPQSAGGALGPDGGISQSWGTGNDETPEPNFQAMVAFDPRMPSWFTLGCWNNQSSCTLY